MKSPTIALALLLAAASAAQAQAPSPQAPASASATSPAKKELVQRLLVLQQGAIEGMSRNVVERPVLLLAQRANTILQTKVPADRREAAAKAMEAEIRQFFNDATPVLRERALKLAPATYGAMVEEKFTEDELRQVVAWLESPVNRKFQQLAPDMQTAFMQQLGSEANTLLGAKLQALERKLSSTLGVQSIATNPPAASKPKGGQ